MVILTSEDSRAVTRDAGSIPAVPGVADIVVRRILAFLSVGGCAAEAGSFAVVTLGHSGRAIVRLEGHGVLV